MADFVLVDRLHLVRIKVCLIYPAFIIILIWVGQNVYNKRHFDAAVLGNCMHVHCSK